MNKKILVTGASGFIGKYVIQELLKLDYQVITSSSDPEKVRKNSWFKSVKHIPFNLKNYSPDINYYDFFERPDIMIHLAWEGLPNYKSLFHIEENLPGHFAFLKNLIVNGLKDLTVTGTCLEYGLQEGSLSEDMPCYPSNPYAVAKDSLRKYMEELQKFHPFSFKWVRLFYMYGEGQNPNSLLSQLDNAVRRGDPVFNMSGGEQVRDYLPVEEVAYIIIKNAIQQQVQGIINCCSGKPISINQFVNNYCKLKNINIKLNPGHYPYTDYEPMRFWGDTTKLNKVIQDTTNQ